MCVLLAVVVSGCAVGVRQPASDITADGAVLHGNVLSTTGGAVKYFVEYSELPQRATPTTRRTPMRTTNLAAGELHPVSEPVDGLRPGRAQYYTVCAEDGENPGDPFCSPFQSFRTAGDSVSGRGVDGVIGDLESSVSLEIGSGPTGEDLSGFGIATTFSGRTALLTPLCLAVDGNRAVIGLRWQDGGLPDYLETRVIEDGGSTGKDRMGAVEGGGCTATDVPLADLVRGDYVVTDVEPSPSS
jgi:hypothetical protein